jgi:hypothetical protein
MTAASDAERVASLRRLVEGVTADGVEVGRPSSWRPVAAGDVSGAVPTRRRDATKRNSLNKVD